MNPNDNRALPHQTDEHVFGRRAVRAAPRALPDRPAGVHYRPIDPRRGGEGLAHFLGWLSLGIGLSQLIAPDTLADLIGVRPSRKTRNAMRALGMREIASGVGILSGKRQADWLWARTAGDAIDLALLGQVAVSNDDERGRNAAAMVVVAGALALDAYAATQVGKRVGSLLQGEPDDDGRGPGAGGNDDFEEASKRKRDSGLRRTTNAITINKPVDEVYAYWRNFENLPRFMRHLVSVETRGNGRSHWKAVAPAGATVEWDAEITDDQPGERISWRSLPGADVQNAGTVRFAAAPGGRGTEVRVDLRYDPPAGKLGAMIAKLYREEPGQQVHDDLRSFKQVMELGEIVLSAASAYKGKHPAQPSDKPVEMTV